MRSLYEIANELVEIMNNAEAEASENDGEISYSLSNQLNALHQEREKKIGNICRYYKSLVAEAKMVKEESDALAYRASETIKKADALKQYLVKFMSPSEPFSDSNTIIKWHKSESVEIDIMAPIPEKYKRIKIEPDKNALKNALKHGEQFEGIRLSQNLNIIIK